MTWCWHKSLRQQLQLCHFETVLPLPKRLMTVSCGLSEMGPPQYHIDGLVQERRNSITKALELRLSCTNPSISRWWRILLFSPGSWFPNSSRGWPASCGRRHSAARWRGTSKIRQRRFIGVVNTVTGSSSSGHAFYLWLNKVLANERRH